MGKDSKIAWTHATFNPWLGCQKVSPGCAFCYAEAQHKRMPFGNLWGPDGKRHVTSDSYWRQPLKWNAEAEAAGERRRVFCGSMCDVMEDRPELEPIRHRLYSLICQTLSLDWLLLTKRPENFRRFLPAAWLRSPMPNVWGMTTMENEDYHGRAWELLETPFVVRGLSIEPMLGPIDLDKFELLCWSWRRGATIGRYLDWVIVGAESGHHARPFDEDWARSVRDQCIATGTPFFYKQRIENGRKIEMPLLDGQMWDQMPEVRP